ncbi:hypothetical protein HanPI659440_Chr11g0440671 [Helianthus annuus]|nr:hypothetical protein HanPI659440_Chr11g0440671 [Helianthus annuus]
MITHNNIFHHLKMDHKLQGAGAVVEGEGEGLELHQWQWRMYIQQVNMTRLQTHALR